MLKAAGIDATFNANPDIFKGKDKPHQPRGRWLPDRPVRLGGRAVHLRRNRRSTRRPQGGAVGPELHPRRHPADRPAADPVATATDTSKIADHRATRSTSCCGTRWHPAAVPEADLHRVHQQREGRRGQRRPSRARSGTPTPGASPADASPAPARTGTSPVRVALAAAPGRTHGPRDHPGGRGASGPAYPGGPQPGPLAQDLRPSPSRLDDRPFRSDGPVPA